MRKKKNKNINSIRPERGKVDYEEDMYENRIRKLVLTSFVKLNGINRPVRAEVEGFMPEKGFD